MDAKLSWALELLALPKFNDLHRKKILLVSDIRNSFIHYKYKPEIEEEFLRNESKYKKVLEDIDKSVTYTKKYQSLIFFKGQKVSASEKFKKWNKKSK